MERLLSAHSDTPVTVVNAGWPGQDSRRVLETLAARMQDYSPEIVCVVVGCNDRWNRPALLEFATQHQPGFRLEWRTGRLAKLVMRGIGALHDQPPPAADSTGIEDAAPRPQGPTEAMIATAGQLVREAGITLSTEPAQWQNEPDPSTRDDVYGARTNIENGDYNEAVARLQAARARTPNEPQIRTLLVNAWTRLGKRELVEPELQQLRERHAADPSLTNTWCLVEALRAAGQTAECVQVAQDGVQRMPLAAGLWSIIAYTELTRDAEAASPAFRRCVELTNGLRQDSASWVAGLGRCTATKDPANGARLLVASVLLQGRLEGFPWGSFQVAAAAAVPKALMRDVIALPDLDDHGRSMLQAAFAEIYEAAPGEWQQVLAAHLEAIDDVVTSFGARCIFGSYPFNGAQNQVVRNTAAARAIDFVAVSERFERELTTRRREELFVADGHCSDAGYAIMAEEIGRAVQRARKQ
jgi:hypothetical protein